MFSDGMSGPPGPRNHKSRPPGRRNAWSVRSVRASTRTARIDNRSKASWSSGRVRSCSKRAVSTEPSAISRCRSASTRNTALRVFASTSVSREGPSANRSGIAGEPLPDPMSMIAAAEATMARCHHGLDEQPVDRFVVRIGQRERGEVDFGVPARQQLEILLEAVEQRAVRGEAGLAQAPGQAFVKVLPGHDLRVVESAALGEALAAAAAEYRVTC